MRRFIPLISRYGALVIQFAVVAVVTRGLSKSDAGLYLSLNGVVQATFFGAGFGTPDGLVRTVSTLRGSGDRRQAGILLYRGTVTSLVSVVPTAALVGAAVGIIGNNVAVGLLFVAWWAAYGFMFVVAQALVASGRGELGTFAFYTLINLGFLVVLVPAAFAGVINDLTNAMAFTAVGAFVSLVAFTPTVVSVLRDADARAGTVESMVPTRRFGRVIAANRIAQAACIWSPVWIASTLNGSSWGADVAVGSRLVGVVGAALAAINFSIRPRIVELHSTSSSEALHSALRRVSGIAATLVFAALVGDLILGRRLIEVFFGRGYANVSWVLVILLIGAGGDAIAGASAEVVKMVGNANWLLSVQIGVFAVGAGLQFLVGWRFGGWAQLAVFSLTMAVFDIIVWQAARKIVGQQKPVEVLA